MLKVKTQQDAPSAAANKRKRVIKRAATAFLDHAGFVKGKDFLTDIFKPYSADDFRKAIEKNVSLVKHYDLSVYREKVSPFAAIARVFPREIILHSWTKKVRPDIYDVIISTPGGEEWWERELDEIEKGVL